MPRHGCEPLVFPHGDHREPADDALATLAVAVEELDREDLAVRDCCEGLRSASRADRFDERTAENVAAASTSVPPAVASEEMVVQSATRSPTGQELGA